MDLLAQDWERFLPRSHDESWRCPLAAAFAGQDIFVTGAGGYLGSALVKTLAAEAPRSLILLDSSEHNLFELQRYMDRAYPSVSCQAILGSVEDGALLDDIFSRLRPQILFHAAAFKHVALLERNLFSAVRNNAVGSYTLAKAARRHGGAKLVLISTDKAVHPHSAMGVSKRVAELMMLSVSGPGCSVNAIRLGNVIGSSGSVVPLLLEQIEKGQSMTVTHPEASRYFLSREEAVTAILAAGIAKEEANILLPQFREPVRIAELAAFLARGRTPVCFTGLRPGEKLTEDLVAGDETQVGIIDGPLTVIKSRRLSGAESDRIVENLSECIASRNAAGLLQILSSLVPEYVPSRLVLASVAAAF